MNTMMKIQWGFLGLACAAFCGCTDEIDNSYSRHQSNLELTTSSTAIVLNESTPDAIALTLTWTLATDYGRDYMTTYLYEGDLIGGTLNDCFDEYIDDGSTSISYTHGQLQDLLVNDWNRLTSTTVSVKFSMTATQEGPTMILPEMSSVTVKIKTYGATQFLADQLFLSGSAAGSDDIQILPSANNPKIYVYNGPLSAGALNFPVVYDDEDRLNRISPLTASQNISDEAMDATITPASEAGVWVIPEADTYRVTVDFANKTVSIVPAGSVLEMDKLYLDGSSVGGTPIEITQTLENENMYAWRGELAVGTLYLPIGFEGETELSLAPSGSGAQSITDGTSVDFKQVDTYDAQHTRYWNIETAGTYRIVVDTDLKRITIYSPATDLPNKIVAWNNTVIGNTNYSAEITSLWMWGGFNSYANDSPKLGGTSNDSGFQAKYQLIQSLANPNIFIYKGDVLPTNNAGKVKFCVEYIRSNVYAIGGDNGTNNTERTVPTTQGTVMAGYAGQYFNRYCYFLIPANTNYVMVDLTNIVSTTNVTSPQTVTEVSVLFDNRP